MFDGDDIPEKLRGKTGRQIIEMYRATEQERGRLTTELGRYRGKRPRDEGRPSLVDTATSEEPAISDDEMRLLPAARLEYQRLPNLGLEDSEELRQQAIEYARQQDAFIRSSVQAALIPFHREISPTVISRDVAQILQEHPVPGVTFEDMKPELDALGLTIDQWNAIPHERKVASIVDAAKAKGYEKFARGEIVPPAAARPSAPAQEPPAMPDNRPRGATAERGNERLTAEVARQWKIWAGYPMSEQDLEELARTELGM